MISVQPFFMKQSENLKREIKYYFSASIVFNLHYLSIKYEIILEYDDNIKGEL